MPKVLIHLLSLFPPLNWIFCPQLIASTGTPHGELLWTMFVVDVRVACTSKSLQYFEHQKAVNGGEMSMAVDKGVLAGADPGINYKARWGCLRG